ncbi:GDP-mannose 4,6-dehydratase [Burkholderia cenocepacia]|uniref:GDP-mannose 4,6-dehydratase n=1 Tax=Burkholderia cenocepacia TaxID=95486 RepID=UPI001BA0701E|nr:GDP-mannose 4,6-dehydratase [Burkholderia cenocepacia]MBR8377277.1 GDP-mannose 4,6-dehydratase [Burkholderia cenocepacia]
MRKIFISGINGFTGTYLARKLRDAGYDVSGLSRVRTLTPWKVHVGTMLDREGLGRVLAAERPDVIIHLAAISTVGHSNPADTYAANVIGTRHLLEAAAQLGSTIRSVLLASSASVYGGAIEGAVLESAPFSPQSDYAVSKVSMEYLASLWRAHLPITIVRPFNYTGVGQQATFVLAKIVDHFRNHAPQIELGNLDIVRDFSDVRDVVHAYCSLADGRQAGQVLNICSGIGYKLRDIVGTMCELSGFEPKVMQVASLIRKDEAAQLIGDRTRLNEAVGDFPRTPLRETLRWMLVGVA